MLSIHKPRPEEINSWLEAQKRRSLNYTEVCGTSLAEFPTGYNHDRNAILLGHGERAYEQAKAALRELRMWDFHWVDLCWQPAPIAEGLILATLTRQWGIWYLNACRIVYLIDETAPTRRFGFGYGTVEGHVERGEERFTVEWRADNSVWYEIAAFSRPVHWITQLGYPMVRRLQKQFTINSRQAMFRAVKAGQ